MKKRIIEKRFVLLALSVLIIIAGFFVYSVIVGNIYRFREVTGTEPVDLNTVKVTCSDESVIRVNSINQQKTSSLMNVIDVLFESVNEGSCKVSVSYQDSESENSYSVREANLCVLPFGFIYDLSYDSFTSINSVIPLGELILLLLIVVNSISFAEKMKRGDFSYSMVIVGGVLLFMILTFITTLADPWFWHIYEYDINTKYILIEIFQSGFAFISITTVPVTMLAVALGISNVWLVIKEGFRPQNILGIITGIIIIGSILIIHMSNYYNSESSDIMYYFTMMTHIVITFLLCYFECMLISTMFCAVASTKYKPEYNMDYIIILGCAIRKDGTPTPILRGRIQRAFDFERKQYEKTGKHAKFVPSGGQGSNEVISEAESMKRCLMEMGVPEADILKEDKSVNTYQNMAFSKKIIEQDAGSLENINIGFSTTNYHVFRGYTLAHKTGMTVKGLSAKTKLYFFPNAFVREFIGLLWEQKLRHIMVAVSVIIFMILMYLSIIY